MSGTRPTSSGGPLAPAAVLALQSVAQHRLLSTEQVRLLRGPEASLRWTRALLGDLERRGLLSHVLANRRRKLWHITRHGARVAERTGALTRRPKLLNAEEASGALQAHTLAVNDAGIAWLRSARARGDDFPPTSWQHEVAHRLGGGRERRRALIADALLTYLLSEGATTSLEYRLLELDRATLPIDRLADKVARYVELHQASHTRGTPVWRAWYPTFPAVHVVLAGARPAALDRRRDAVLALCRSDALVERAQGLAISICLFADLRDHGPFAPIFTTPDGRQVDWLGRLPSRHESRRG